MHGFLKYTAVMAVSVSAFIACNGGAAVIPRDKLAMIYAEMLVADQMIYQDPSSRRRADTTWVYEPIFQKYGYTSDDYRASVEFYMKDPDRFARIFRNTGVILEKELAVLEKEKAALESLTKLQEEIETFAPERIYALTGIGNDGLVTDDSLTFYLDSAGGELFFDTRQWLDTAYYGPEMVLRDTVAVRDTVAADKIAAGPETGLQDGRKRIGDVPVKAVGLMKHERK